MSDRVAWGFTVTLGRVLFATASPSAYTVAGGIRFDNTDGSAYTEEGGTPTQTIGLFSFSAGAALQVVDASGGLPATVYRRGGFCFDSSGRLCVDGTNTAAYYLGGVPMTVLGAVCATGLTPSGAIVTEGDVVITTEGGDTLVVE